MIILLICNLLDLKNNIIPSVLGVDSIPIKFLTYDVLIYAHQKSSTYTSCSYILRKKNSPFYCIFHDEPSLGNTSTKLLIQFKTSYSKY